jgi:hypothetical protein
LASLSEYWSTMSGINAESGRLPSDASGLPAVGTVTAYYGSSHWGFDLR